MSDNGGPGGLPVTCAKCQFAIHLSEDEIVLFSANFFCLRCGTRMKLPVEGDVLTRLKHSNDRDRRPPDVAPAARQDTMKHVR